jgi:hypothetical protein
MRKSRSIFVAGFGSLLFVGGAFVACSGDDVTTSPIPDSGSPRLDSSAPGVDASPVLDAGPLDGSTADASAPPGPGAALLCPSSGKNAFATYGASAFVAVNKAIIANVGAQLATDAGAAGLGPTFAATGKGMLDGSVIAALDDSPTVFEGKLAAFLVYAYGGPSSITYTDGQTYSGLQDMVVAHKGLNVTPSQYDYFVTNVVVPALTSNGVPSNDLSGCFAPLLLSTTFMQEIVGNGATAGSDLACSSSGKNAFATYGTAAFVAVNESIITGVMTQEATDAGAAGLGPTFPASGSGMLDDASVPALDDALPTFKGKLASFLVWSLGGPPQITYTDGVVYSGIQGLTTEHTGLAVTADQYNYFVTNVIVPALTSNGVSTADVTSCFAPVVTDPNFVAQVVGH